MTKLFNILAFLFVCSLPFSATAGEKKVNPYMQEKIDKRKAEIKRFDTNKDGVLQEKELQGSLDQKFMAADTNKDGILTQAETDAVLGKYKADQQKANKDPKKYNPKQTDYYSNRMENRYKASDKDKDGNVSKDEYKEYMGRRLDGLDRNGDGIVDSNEYRTEEEKAPLPSRKK